MSRNAFAKFHRASELASYLLSDKLLGCYRKSVYLAFTSEDDADYIRLYISCNKDIAFYFQIILGEVISSLRSSLDYIIYEMLVERNGLASAKDSYFPVRKNVEDFTNALDKKPLALLSDEVKRVLIRDIQPYRDGRGSIIFYLNLLRNIDKHRLILTSTPLSLLKLNRVRAQNTLIENCFVSDDMKLKYFQLKPPVTELSYDLSCDIVIDEDEIVDYFGVTDFIETVSTYVFRALHTLNAARSGAADSPVFGSPQRSTAISAGLATWKAP